MSQLLKSSGAIGAATLTSRVLGMVREIVYARFMGDTWVAGAFMLAFTVPNLLRRLLGEGVLTATFIPRFKQAEKQAGEAATWHLANSVLCALVAVCLVVVALVVLGTTSVLNAGGFLEAKTVLLLQLLRVMSPYILFVCVAAVLIGMANARGHFFIPAMGATTLNVVMIGSVLWLAPLFGPRLEDQIFGLAVGVVVAGLAQAAFQMPVLRREGFRFQWVSPAGNPEVRAVAVEMIPGAIGVAAFQLNVVITQGFAYLLDPSIVASFQYAVRLMELPQGVFGISLATYLLPTLSGLVAEKKFPEFRATLNQGLGHLVCLNLLASVLLLVLAGPIVRLLFERGNFNADSTARTALALASLAPGLVAFSSVNILARGFYALGDTRTPMKISVFCLLLNIVISAALVIPFKQAGLGAANTITSLINLALLVFALRKKLGRLDMGSLRSSLAGSLTAAAAAGLAAWSVCHLWATRLGHGSLPLRLGEVFVPMMIATAVYFGASALAGVPAARELVGIAWKRLRPGGRKP